MADMKTRSTPSRWFQAGLIMSVVAVVVPSVQAAGRWATLEAIHQIENPMELTRRGAHGELGAYQFRETTWRMHTNEPFSRALDRAKSDMVAVRHYEWLKKGLERAGLVPTPYNIALAWNGGLDAVVQGRSVAGTHDYARRAVNLAQVLESRAASMPQIAEKERAVEKPPVFMSDLPPASIMEPAVVRLEPVSVGSVADSEPAIAPQSFGFSIK